MMDFEQGLRVSELRSRLIRSTYDALKEDGLHKSSEAAIDITFCIPGMFSDDQSPRWCVMVYSYVLGPNRSHHFMGKSLNEAIAKAEDAVKTWCLGWEMKAFGERMGLDDEEGLTAMGNPEYKPEDFTLDDEQPF